jgi:ferredoxin
MKLLLCSILFLLAPCNNPKQNSSSKKNNSKVVIIYQCGACFGRCPEYILTINGEKKMATFKGIKNTEKIGTYTKKISDAELTDYVSNFEKAKFNSFENEYLGYITDFPIKAISYTNNGSTKLVKERSGAPEMLISLEKKLQAYAENGEGWVKSEDQDH